MFHKIDGLFYLLKGKMRQMVKKLFVGTHSQIEFILELVEICKGEMLSSQHNLFLKYVLLTPFASCEKNLLNQTSEILLHSFMLL